MGWQHGRYHGLGMDALAHGCAGSRDVIIILAMDALASVWAGSSNVIMVLGMDALANGRVGSMDVIMVWAWMHWPREGW